MRDTKFAYNMVKRFYGFLSNLYPTGYEIYEKYMFDTCSKVVTATPENLKSIIDDLILIKSAERSILETHFEPGYFEQKWQELIAFSGSNEYYTALRNILTSPDFEVNETFKQNAIEVVSLNNNKRAKRLLGRKIYKQFNQKG